MATRLRKKIWQKMRTNAYNECVIWTGMVDSLENGCCCCCCRCRCRCRCRCGCCCCCCCFHVNSWHFLCNFTHIDSIQTNYMNLLRYTSHNLLINYGFKIWDEQNAMWTMNMGMAQNCWSPKWMIKLLDLLNFTRSPIVRTSCKLGILWYQLPSTRCFAKAFTVLCFAIHNYQGTVHINFF